MEWKKVKVLYALCAFFVFCFYIYQPLIFAGNINDEIKRITANLPFSFPQISMPEFPDKYFDIKNYGAKGDGIFKNTEAINKAIEECSSAGGGHVVIPAGLWLTGPIKLKSKVDLHLEKGALVVFSSDHKDYNLISSGSAYVCESPISGTDVDNIAITGEGLFNGNGQTWRPVKKNKLTASQWKALVSEGGVVDKDKSIWWPSQQAMNAEAYLAGKDKKKMTSYDYENVKDFLRPNLLHLNNCSKVLLEGFTLQNPPKFHLNASRCTEMIITNVKVMTDEWAQNGDGLDLSSCKNVVMFNCTVNAGDDGICMKSSPVKGDINALENIVISDCVVYHAHGGFVIGSNTDGGIKNISVRNCNFIGTDTGLRFKSNAGKGSRVSNVFIENVFMKDIRDEAITFDMTYENNAVGNTVNTKKDVAKIPDFQNFIIKNVICDGAGKAMLVAGVENIPITKITLANSVFKTKNGMDLNFAQSFVFDDVKIYSANGPVFTADQCRNLQLINVAGSNDAPSFMKISGSKTEKISLEKVDLSGYKTPFEFLAGADKNAVINK